MSTVSSPSATDGLSLEEAIARLMASPLVDGIAEFGSRTTGQATASSDYDLLVLVEGIPARVFQMLTTIGGRMADIVLVEVEAADAILSGKDPLRPGSFEGMFAEKMRTARILYDGSERLRRVQQWVTGDSFSSRSSGAQGGSGAYVAWFWQSFGLLQLERMAQSQDSAHRSAVDMMLTSCLPGTWRGYFGLRAIPWEGEKAAIRYWETHDKEYLEAVRECLETNDRNRRLTAYRRLVELTLKPVGKALGDGETAVVLRGENGSADVQAVLEYWRSLFGS